MIKALFCKEWIKTRGSVLLATAIMAAGAAYTYINTAQAFRLHGAVQVWNAVITKDAAVLPDILRWLPVCAGVVLALSQFIPEMTDKRFKLTLHLPLPEGRILSTMLCYGLAVLGGLFLATCAAVALCIAAYYPAETLRAVSDSSLPWFLAGWYAYLAAAWICLEPSWRYRLSYALTTVCTLPAFFIAAPTGAYGPFIPWLLAVTALCYAFPFYSAARFKEGVR